MPEATAQPLLDASALLAMFFGLTWIAKDDSTDPKVTSTASGEV